MPKVTTQDVTVSFKNYGDITVPAGTRVTHQTAMGIDPKYNFVDEYKWIQDKYPTVASILKHDVMHYGINIPAEFVKEVGNV